MHRKQYVFILCFLVFSLRNLCYFSGYAVALLMGISKSNHSFAAEPHLSMRFPFHYQDRSCWPHSYSATASVQYDEGCRVNSHNESNAHNNTYKDRAVKYGDRGTITKVAQAVLHVVLGRSRAVSLSIQCLSMAPYTNLRGVSYCYTLHIELCLSFDGVCHRCACM